MVNFSNQYYIRKVHWPICVRNSGIVWCFSLFKQATKSFTDVDLKDIFHIWPSSWLGGQTFWLLTMRFRVRFPFLPWEFSLAGEDPYSEHGLGSM
jgi:hypothetical protein